MKRRTVILYWLLLLVPTVLICLGAIRLLWHEQERLADRARDAARRQAESVADSLLLAVGTAQDELLDALKAVRIGEGVAGLIDWERSHPLVRNVFVWEASGLLAYPHEDPRSTAEERRFRKRFSALFVGVLPWEAPAKDEAPAATARSEATSSGYDGESVYRRNWSVLSELRSFSRTARTRQELMPAVAAEGQAESSNAPVDSLGPRSGWTPWYSDNQLSLIGWYRPEAGRDVIGLELEFMALLSRLVALLPSAPEGMTMALVDGQGRVIHQQGPLEIPVDRRAEISVDLDPLLPHWRLEVFANNGAFGTGNLLFVLLSGLLLLIFAVAIIGGGAMLQREARRSQLDAQQKTTFVSNVSHELKTPLTSIRMYAELLNEDRVKDPQKRKRYLDVIANESQRLTRLVNNVLDFSRLEQGRKKYQRTSVELGAFLVELLEAYRMRIEEAEMTLQLDLLESPCTLQVDKDALEQVVLNLVDNALKYGQDGGELRVSLEALEGVCRIRVMDRGAGVPIEHRKRIFEKFHRVDDSLTASRPGSGLGLTIAKGLLQDLGGDLIYAPREGGGSCFIIELPCASR